MLPVLTKKTGSFKWHNIVHSITLSYIDIQYCMHNVHDSIYVCMIFCSVFCGQGLKSLPSHKHRKRKFCLNLSPSQLISVDFSQTQLISVDLNLTRPVFTSSDLKELTIMYTKLGEPA